MCCWSVKVTVTVTGNLVLRVCTELTDVVYKILIAWWCSSLIRDQKSSGNDLNMIRNYSWFVTADRESAEEILKNKIYDGAFLVRPSSNPDNVCTLSVLQNGQPFHINIRQRVDGWLALGKTKPNEHCFATIPDIVEFYKNETLVINSYGEKYLTVLKEQLSNQISV